MIDASNDTQLSNIISMLFSCCLTVEPNTALVPLIDNRLTKLAEIAGTSKILYAQITFVDIAGLIAGASSGAGLGNKFLANIADATVLLHVVRCFENSEIIHVDSKVDPVADIVREYKET